MHNPEEGTPLTARERWTLINQSGKVLARLIVAFAQFWR